MLIMEPCNYASNIAYYHSTVRTCDYPDWHFPVKHVRAIKRGFATLAAGSAMMHGSHTDLGGGYDNYNIAVIAYAAYRAVVEKLGATSRTILSLSLD